MLEAVVEVLALMLEVTYMVTYHREHPFLIPKNDSIDIFKFFLILYKLRGWVDNYINTDVYISYFLRKRWRAKLVL